MKNLRYLSSVVLVGFLLLMANCGEESDIGIVCAGCPNDSPWSVAGSTQCYNSFDDCNAVESGDCTICN